MEHDSELEMLPLSFLHLTGNLKHLPRTGWLRAIESPESVAAHMYRLSLLAILAPVGLTCHITCTFTDL